MQRLKIIGKPSILEPGNARYCYQMAQAYPRNKAQLAEALALGTDWRARQCCVVEGKCEYFLTVRDMPTRFGHKFAYPLLTPVCKVPLAEAHGEKR
jgi:hypothetical protein